MFSSLLSSSYPSASCFAEGLIEGTLDRLGRKGGTLEKELKPSQSCAQTSEALPSLLYAVKLGAFVIPALSNHLEEVQGVCHVP